MSGFTIDINCDLGEGVGNEAAIMPLLSSCNIACGMHAGDEHTMRSTISLAIKHNVKIGAHPSFPDRENFGRTEMDLPSAELEQVLIKQISQFNDLVKEQQAVMHHVKPHGALYNMATVSQDVAETIIRVMKNFDQKVILYLPFASVIEKVALANNIPVKYEAFADRNYNNDLTLVSRKLENALLKDVGEIFEHVVPMITEQKVKTVTAEWIRIKADTLCVHGDNPNAPQIVQHLTKKLSEVNITIA